jgi:hypothetical protein
MTERKPPDDKPIVQMLRVIELIDCVPGHAPTVGGRPISMITFAHLGELEQPLALSFEDTKLLTTKLLESLAEHGHEPSRWLLKEYFQAHKSDLGLDDSDDEAEPDYQ